jgi:two-component system, cell cycle sensor histidine kinase and response regulator CckA
MTKATDGRVREPDASEESAAPASAVVAGELRRSWLARTLRRTSPFDTPVDAQRLVQQISRQLLDTPTNEWRLSEAIGAVAAYLGADAAALLEVSDDDSMLACSAQWRDPTVVSWQSVPALMPISAFPWLAANLHRVRKPFVVPRLVELPAAADEARGVLTAMGVRSFGVVPLRREERVEAVLFVFWQHDRKLPSPARLEPLGMVADALLSALARRSVEQELHDNESRFTAVLRESLDVVVLWADDGTVKFASEALERISGIPPVDFSFEHAAEHVHADDVVAMCVRYGEALSRPRESVPTALRLRRADGEWCYLEGTFTNLVDEASIGGVVLYARDVSDRVGLEARLAQAEKMAALGRMAGSVAHDFRNLTFAMRSFAELAIAQAEQGQDLSIELQEIVKGCMHADSLVSQLLSFGQATSICTTVIDPSAALDELRPAIAQLVPASVELVVEHTPPLPHVGISRTQLEQILVNLVTNAVDAMPAGGRLHVALDRAADLGLASAHVGWLRIVVSDTGIGMEEAVRAQVFEPFFTTKLKDAASPGNGLGLSIVYAVTAAAGGVVAVESTSGEGTRVEVRLPPVGA